MSYELYLARVTETNSRTDSLIDGRIRCRILPVMEEGISDSMCPLFPYFFKDQLLMASVGDLVWVISNTDFSLGYVLGMANYNEYTDKIGTFEGVTTSFESKFSKAMVSLLGTEASFSNMKIEYYDGSCIHFIERSTGGKIMAFDSGTLYIMRPDEFAVTINGVASIKLSKSGFSANGESIALESESVGLGKNSTNKILTTSGEEGAAAIASKYAKA